MTIILNSVKNTKRTAKVITTAVLVLLMASSAFLVFSNSRITQAQAATGTTQYPWTMANGNYNRTGFQDGPAPSIAHLLWASPMSGVPSTGIVIADGKVFQGCYNSGDVFAYDQNTGQQLWTTHLNNTAYNVMYYNGKIFTTGGAEPHDDRARGAGNEIIALDAETGKIVWIWVKPMMINGVDQNATGISGYHSASTSSAYPTVYQGRLYVNFKGGFLALDPDTGKPLQWWVSGVSFYALNGGKAYGIINGTYAYQGDLATMTNASSSVDWRSDRTLLNGGSFTAISAGQVFVLSADSTLHGIDITTGNILTEYRPISTFPTAVSNYTAQPAVAYRNLYLAGWDGALYCIDQFTLNTYRWKFQTGGTLYQAPAVADGKVYFGSVDGYFYCIDASSGALVWKYNIGSFIGGSVGIADGSVYIAANDGYMYCFGTAPASSMSLSAPTTITVGQSLTMTGKLVTGTGAGIAGASVALKYLVVPAVQWTAVTTVTTASDGSFSYTMSTPYDGYYTVASNFTGPDLGGYASSGAVSLVRVAPTTATVSVDLSPVTNAIGNETSAISGQSSSQSSAISSLSSAISSQTSAINSLQSTVSTVQTYLIVAVVLVIVAIAISMVAVVYSRRKSK